MSTQTTYSQTCFMEPDRAARVFQITSCTKFSAIRIIIDPDRKTYDPFLAQQIPEGKVLVILEIPREGVCMLDFYGEFYKALNQELTVAIQGERER